MLSGHRVLVVEDDYFLASELEQELAAAGAAVLGPVPSVKAALDLLEHETPDAAVLDVNLGGEMVFPVADALAAGGVPFFFVTGYDRAVLPERHAAARWLSKPVETSATVREFRRLLGAAA
jgi:DNA-binding response OmpR family regulator